MMEEGYLLVSCGKELYKKLTVRMIHNILSFDNSRMICVLTDEPSFFDDHPNKDRLIIIHFDYNNHTCPQLDFTNFWHQCGYAPKMFQSYYTPFKTTMYCDSDMLFFQDMSFLFDEFRHRNHGYPILLPGVADENGCAPPHWHWGGIMDVIYRSGLNIPQCSSTILVYDKSFQYIVAKHIPYIMEHLQEWNVRLMYWDGLADETVYSIICSLENIRVNESVHSKIFYDHSFVNPLVKEI
jgi:hypothetical protein